MVRGSATPTVTRAKGIVGVTRPSLGIFCVTLVPSIDAASIVPAITPEWVTSTDAAIFAYFRDGTVCPPGTLEVQTGHFDTLLPGQIAFADESFTIVVP